MKKEIPIELANRLINHGPLVLVTSLYRDKANIIPVAWQTPVSISPALVAISVNQNSLSAELIDQGEEFVINVPPVSLLDKVKFCGAYSGREVNKFDQTGLTPLKARMVKPSLIEECIGHIECQLYGRHTVGDHKLFIGGVVAASVDEDKFDGYLRAEMKEAKTLHHLGGSYFLSSGDLVPLT
ncbi:MAG: flavin reductase family protein [bacterium]|nr:flavin reductase family protein [bacterium]